jgi:hypothetical protein
VIYVNLDRAAISITLPRDLTRMQDRREQARYAAGSRVSLGGQDAAFFLNTSVLRGQ